MDSGLGETVAKKGMSIRCAADGKRNGNRRVRKGSGTRTIYLYTINWTVCGHREEKLENAVRK
jgi:hypothetical protein